LRRAWFQWPMVMTAEDRSVSPPRAAGCSASNQPVRAPQWARMWVSGGAGWPSRTPSHDRSAIARPARRDRWCGNRRSILGAAAEAFLSSGGWSRPWEAPNRLYHQSVELSRGRFGMRRRGGRGGEAVRGPWPPRGGSLARDQSGRTQQGHRDHYHCPNPRINAVCGHSARAPGDVRGCRGRHLGLTPNMPANSLRATMPRLLPPCTAQVGSSAVSSPPMIF